MSITNLEYQTNYSLVTAILPRDSRADVLEQAIPDYLNNAVVIHARGSLERKRWYERFLPVINPEQEVVELIAPDDQVDTIMNNFVIAAGMNRHGGSAVYSISCGKALFMTQLEQKRPIDPLTSSDGTIRYKHDMVGIFCTTQKGKSDAIINAAIAEGSPAPTIVYGQGRGIREKLGLLRIAISPEKELVRVIVNSYDADPVFNAMVENGNLDQPGMGFIYYMPVSKALVNIAAASASGNQLATQHQIVKAIDDMQDGTLWRSATTAQHGRGILGNAPSFLTDLTRVSCVTERGRGDVLVEAILSEGVSGATVAYGRKAGVDKHLGKTDITLSKEVEIIEIILQPDLVDHIVDKLVQEARKTGNEDIYFYTKSVPKALTYFNV